MSTTLRTLFSKPVDRPIDGVIKADDEESLLNELEEYVVTNEIEKNISSFLSNYNNYTNKNGIWISGFFGSGKSHLLKMLSLVLEDKHVEEKSAAQIFLNKISHDAFLKSELEKAVTSVLKAKYNIVEIKESSPPGSGYIPYFAGKQRLKEMGWEQNKSVLLHPDEKILKIANDMRDRHVMSILE